MKLSSLDYNYKSGMLSNYPEAIDNNDSLFMVSNNAETVLKQSIGILSKYIIVEDAKLFPNSGIIRIAPNGAGIAELVHYGKKTGNQFHDLERGYAGHRQSSWPAGSKVTLPVTSEHHNAIKDAIINIQKRIGLKDKPEDNTLHAEISALEKKWLVPRPAFKVHVKEGTTPLHIRFQNLSNKLGFRFLWDFGDGTTSTEPSPIHIYENEGLYNVKLTMVSSMGTVGMLEKRNLISVVSKQLESFFYADPINASTNTEIAFIDQTDADVVERHFFFGDGEEETLTNPNLHVVKHTYKNPGQYKPSLLIRLPSGKIIHSVLADFVEVK